ncbi:MAG TPA: peptide chain release factor N(5)-glutamine methyltransferase [Clostridia bacterium]|nr:peptide chain release factor N(5)-glutamine methyltransferase [Clostridia bacterium]
MTYSEALKTGTQLLKDANIEAPAVDAGALLCAAANCGRVFLYAHGDSILEEGRLQEYLSALKKRAQGYPLQYLTGVQEFMSLPFETGPGVLIPRQETELLVETVLRFCEERASSAGPVCGGTLSAVPVRGGTSLHILDIGTGSGCIAISLAHYLQYCAVTAVDKMEDALTIARRNALKNGVEDRIDFIKGDLFQNVEYKAFDVIVSNPPYIRSGDIPELMREVRDHEPRTALDGGRDGLDFYREIVKLAPVYMKRGGLLAFETGYDQAGAVASLMSTKFVEIKTFRDLSGTERVVSAICAGMS